MKSIALLGAGGHGRVVAEIAELNGFEKIIFFDDKYPKQHRSGSWGIKGRIADIREHLSEFDEVMVTIGDNITRAKLARDLGKIGKLGKLIHPSSEVSSYANILPGTVIMANAVINAYSTVEENVIVNTSSVIDHDSTIHEASHISPGAILAGNVTIGGGSWIGLGAKILEGITIGKEAIVGAGSVVTKSFPDKVVLTGMPAKVSKHI